MHPAAIKLAREILADYLEEKGFRLARNVLRFNFLGGCVLTRLRGCNKFNRDSKLPWSFQLDSWILFDDLDFDPHDWPREPTGRRSGMPYSITKTEDKRLAEQVAAKVCANTDDLIRTQILTRALYRHRIKQRQAVPSFQESLRSLERLEKERRVRLKRRGEQANR